MKYRAFNKKTGAIDLPLVFLVIAAGVYPRNSTLCVLKREGKRQKFIQP